MSDGAFRDDQEAALARADALEVELARAKRENVALRDKAEKLEHEKDAEHRRADKAENKVPKPEPAEPKPARTTTATPTTNRVTYAVAAAAIVGTVVLTFAIPYCRNRARDRSTLEVTRWKALVALPKCLRTALGDDPMVGVDPATQDPRASKWNKAGTPQMVGTTCLNKLDTLAGMDAFASERPNLARWHVAIEKSDAAVAALNDYYTHQDWKDDQFASGPRKWHTAQVESAEQHAAARAIADRVLPILESSLRHYQKGYEDRNGRDAVWWSIELGCLLQTADDEWLRGDVAKATIDAAAVVTAAAGAPLEIRRATRDGYKLSSAYFKNELLRGVDASVVP